MAKARCENQVKLLGVVQRRRSALMMTTALQTGVSLLLVLPAQAQPAPNARPTGGVVTAGSASISQGASTTTIAQSSQRAAVNWRSFDVGSQQTVQFRQPSSSAMTLNRVVGPDPSQIAGKIDANGQVVLVNQSGVTFYKGAQVNTTGLMVSAVGITNKNFMAGNMVFDQPGNPNAKVSNAGTITVKQAGLAALVAPQVANSGVINAKLGHVVLAGAKTATLDLYGDGLLSLDVSNQVTKAPLGPDGKAVTALVTNSGVIAADGGTVQLTARAADGVVQTLVRSGGTVRAATVGNQTGTVALNGVGGAIEVVGQLSAKGPAGSGGAIEVATDGNVGIASTARIDASGKSGGGTVAIGTTLARAKGGPSVTGALTAKNVTVQQGATIAANATGKGNGGQVTVLSASATNMAGTINAKGGLTGGNGGNAEVSGADLSLTGAVDLSAPNGTTGTLLLDPDNLTIIHSTSASGSLDPTLNSNKQIVYGDDAGGTDTITDFVLNGLNANILLQAVQTITLNPGAPLTLGANKSLTMQTQTGSITIGSSITASGAGGIIIQAGTNAGSVGQLILNADLIADTTKGAIALQAGGGISLNANLSAATVDLSNIKMGGVVQTTGGLTAATLQSTGGVVGGATLMSPSNAIDFVGTFTVTGGGFALADTAPLTVLGVLSSDSNVYLQNLGSIAVAAAGTVAAGAASQASFQAVSLLNAGTVTGGTFEFAPNAGGTVALGGVKGSLNSLAGIAANNIEIGGITVAGTFTPEASLITTLGAFDVGNRPLALHSTGAITEGAGDPILNVSTLTGTAGGVSLSASNSIANIGSFTVTGGGDFSLSNASSTGVLGTLSANNVTLNEPNTATMNVSGTIAATGTTSLNSGTIALGSGAFVQGSTVTLGSARTLLTGNAVLGKAGQTTLLDISASSGGVSEAVAAMINAGTLQSSGAISGGATLIGTTNSIAAIGNVPVNGFFELVDAAALTVDGALTATGQTLLKNSNSGGISIIPSGTVAAGVTSEASFQAATLSNAGTITGGTFEFAPNAGKAVTLGSGGSLLSLAGIGTNNIEIGGFTLPGGGFTRTATLIATTGTFDVGNRPLALNTTNTGTITEGTGDPIINVSTLTGSAGAAATLGQTNSIANIGSFAVSGGDFLLADSGFAGTLTVLGSLSANNVTLSGIGALAINGSISASGIVNLANFSTLGEGAGGLISAGTLTGNTPTSANFSAINQIGTLDNFNAGAGLTLNDSLPLFVAGTVAGSSVALTDAGTLTIAGSVNAPSIGLTGQSISIPGTVNGGTVGLVASTGGISEPGSLSAGTLIASAATGVSLTGTTPTTNLIGTLAGLTAGSAATLDDGQPLTITGNATAASIGLSATSIDVLGTIAAGSVTLAGTTGPIVLTGNALVGQAGATVDLSAANSGVSEGAGSGIIAATLQSSGGVTGPAILTGGGNVVGGIGTFSVSGGDFILTDNGNLMIAGPLNAINVSITTTGGISGSGSVTAGLGGALALTGAGGITLGNGATLASDTAIDLNGGGGPIVLNGNATVRSLGVVDLTTTSGGVTEAPTSVIAASLLQSAAGVSGNVTLAGTANAIAQLGLFNASGNFALLTGGVLNVVSNVSASSVSLTADGGIALTGGTLTGAVVDLNAPSGGVNEAASAAINAGTLQSTRGVTGTVSLTGTANAIANIGSFAVTGGAFDLADNGNLNVTGPLSAGAVAIDDGAGVTVSGILAAGNIAIAAQAIDITGTLTDGGAGAVNLVGPTGINETGVLIAGTLTGSTSGSAAFTGATPTSNRIAVVNNFTAPGFLTLYDGIPLTLTGILSNGAGAVIVDKGALAINGSVVATASSLTADSLTIPGSVMGSAVTLVGTTGAIAASGTIDAAALTGNAATDITLTGPNQIVTLNDLSAGGNLAVNDAISVNIGRAVAGSTLTIVDTGSLTIGGAVSAAAVGLTANSIGITGGLSGGTASLSATSGQINETGAMNVGTLTGSTPLAAKFVGANNIAVFGPFTSNGLTLLDNSDLGISGFVNAGTSAAISAYGSLAINGTLSATSVNLISGSGAINETGALLASTLTGSAPGDVTLSGNGANQIATLNGFLTDTLFALNDSRDLTINGPLAAPTIVINAPNSLVTLSDGATISTGGVPRPPGLVATFPTSATTEGAYLSVGNFQQNGKSTVQGFANSADPNILRISVTGAGGIAFSKTGGLQGSNTWLILDIDSGLASGDVFVRSLDVNRTGATGATELVGTVGGVKGPAAAGAAGISPSPSSNFRFNSCPIHSVNCVLLTAQAIPTANPLNDIAIGSLYNPNDQDDLLLPIVSDQDY